MSILIRCDTCGYEQTEGLNFQPRRFHRDGKWKHICDHCVMRQVKKSAKKSMERVAEKLRRTR